MEMFCFCCLFDRIATFVDILLLMQVVFSYCSNFISIMDYNTDLILLWYNKNLQLNKLEIIG